MRDLAPHAANGFRALMIHDVVPAGHVAIPVLHDRWEPHIHAGEFAVLDPSDVEPQFGELYGIMISCPRFATGRVLKVVQPYRSPLAGRDSVMYRFSAPRPRAMGFADGPLRLDGWREQCRGRVVGVLSLAEVEGAHV